MFRNHHALAFVIAACAAGTASAADSYPSHPVRFIVAQPPGGGTDVTARMRAPNLAEKLGQQVVVDNRGGAGGIVGTETAARSAPDGYTLLLGYTGALSINPSLYPKLPYDPVRDFDTVSLAISSPYVLFANPKVPVSTVADIIALAKAKPGTLAFASAGNGSLAHLALEWFKLETGTNIIHVPYKGGQSLTAVLSGEVQLTFGSVVAWLPQVKAGRLKAIAVTSKARSKALPSLPTVAESGVPGFEAINWFGVVVPHGTPKPVIERLNGIIVAQIKLPAMSAKLAEDGTDAVASTPEAFSSLIRAEIKRWAAVVKQSGAKVD
jgi:tripartite-type tricarboxylate transporter receptor subunit TctC